jgi:hypothetical protein
MTGKLKGLGLCLLLLGAGRSWADNMQSDPNHLALGGKLGVETDTLYINEGSPNGLNGAANIAETSLGLNYWLSDKSALQLFGFCSFYSSPDTDFTGNIVYDFSDTWGLGLGYKYNVSEPFKGLFIQLLGRVTYAQNSSPFHQPVEFTNGFSETLGFFAGAGFEFFIPFWQALSLSANVGYLVTYNDGWSSTEYNPGYGGTNSYESFNYWRGGILSNGFTITTIAINFYF